MAEVGDTTIIDGVRFEAVSIEDGDNYQSVTWEPVDQ